jgi:hypothetical protein
MQNQLTKNNHVNFEYTFNKNGRIISAADFVRD